MKRKNTNITTASLRSSSSKNRSKRRANTLISNNLASSRSNLNSNNQTTHKVTTKTARKSTTIGSSSKQTFTCLGCKNEFKIYLNVSDFMKKHPKSNDRCHKAFPKCVCGKIFYDKTHLKSHQSRSSKTKECWKQYQREITDTKFNSSEVIIQPIKSKSKLLTDDQNPDQNPMLSSKKELMLSKQPDDFSTFLSTVKFQNMNIHKAKITIPSKFEGIATADPKSLMLKQHVIHHGIYCQPISEQQTKQISSTSATKKTQIVDLGDFAPDFNNENNVQNENADFSSISESKSQSNKSFLSSLPDFNTLTKFFNKNKQ